MSNEGRAFASNGEPNARAAVGRLLVYLRAHSGEEITGREMDRAVDELYGDRCASTRKSGLNERIDPRVEWICHSSKRQSGRKTEIYKHVWTRGRLPYEKPLRKGCQTPATRLKALLEGKHVPPQGYYERARAEGRLPVGFEPPEQDEQAGPDAKRPAAPTRRPDVTGRTPEPTQGQLFNLHRN